MTTIAVVGNPKPRSRTRSAAELVVEKLTGAPPDRVVDVVDLGAGLLGWGDPAVEEAVAAVAADQPPEVRQRLSIYLSLVPAAVRASLRRPADPADDPGEDPPGQRRDHEREPSERVRRRCPAQARSPPRTTA
jgi:hypothetical protein